MSAVVVWAGPSALGVGAVALVGALMLEPRPGEPVTAVMPPGTSASETFSAALDAGLLVTRIGPLDNLVTVAWVDPEDAGPVDALWRLGAVAVINGGGFFGCGSGARSGPSARVPTGVVTRGSTGGPA